MTKRFEFSRSKCLPNQLRARIAVAESLVQAKYDEAFQDYDPALELIT